ncbi:MAG: S8 family serine peptidase [Hyphomicrobiaceae bacterium]
MTRVGLIDLSVAWKHPNLVGCVDTSMMIDFFSARYGAFPRPKKDFDWAAQFQGLGDMELGPRSQQLYDNLRRRLCNSQDSRHAAPTTRPAFSAHGTAMTGLIGARPVSWTYAKPKFLEPMDQFITGALSATTDILPYAGVDPFCKIVPISTSFDPDPEQYILALLYAHIADVDLIVLARDFSDPNPANSPATPSDRHPDGEVDVLKKNYPVSQSPGERELWVELRNLICEISKKRPILCAAGNGGDDMIIYPASLAADDNGIIAIGAVAASGQTASYSSASDPGQNAVYAPGGDGERVDKEIQRRDVNSPDFDSALHDSSYKNELHTSLDVGGPDRPNSCTFAIEEVITTDVPGRFGYNGSLARIAFSETNEVIDFGSLFARFSGTSAAVAIAGGFLSLAYSAGKLPSGDGLAAKQFLHAAGGTHKGEVFPSCLRWDRIPRL